MMGAIVGDIVGSEQEFSTEKRWDVPLITESCTFTDDTVLTVATAEAILRGSDYGSEYAVAFKRHSSISGRGPGHDIGYGTMFAEWAMSARGYREPYGSLGNGSAMRVSPVAWAFDDLYEVLVHAQRSAECTHNHVEGVRGAQAVAMAVWLARSGHGRNEIGKAIKEVFGYEISTDLDHLHETYTFDSTCPGSVPQALACVLQAESFEQAMRNCLYIGGDTDTIGAIAGSIAEPLFGVPVELRQQAAAMLQSHAPRLWGIVEEFERTYGRKLASGRRRKGFIGALARWVR